MSDESSKPKVYEAGEVPRKEFRILQSVLVVAGVPGAIVLVLFAVAPGLLEPLIESKSPTPALEDFDINTEEGALDFYNHFAAYMKWRMADIAFRDTVNDPERWLLARQEARLSESAASADAVVLKPSAILRIREKSIVPVETRALERVWWRWFNANISLREKDRKYIPEEEAEQ